MTESKMELIVRKTAELESSERLEDVIALHSLIQVTEKRMRELKQDGINKILNWIDRNGEFEWQGKRYYKGPSYRYSCTDKVEALEQLFDACGGDFTQISEALSSGWFKVSEMKEKIGEEMTEKLFPRQTIPDLKTGKPKKGLKVVDTKYLK